MSSSGPRTVFFGNNHVGAEILSLLAEGNENVVACVFHPANRQRHGDRLNALAARLGCPVLDGSNLKDKAVLDTIIALRPDIGISAFFGYIMSPSLIGTFPNGCINLHPSLLPYNRGANPNVWSIVEKTPAGVSIHYVDSGVDTGPVIAQSVVPVEPADTAKTLYERLERAAIELFGRSWPAIRAGTVSPFAQEPRNATAHRSSEFEELRKLDLDQRKTLREFLDILRACTYPPYPGAYYDEDGRRISVRVELEYVEE